MSTLPETKVIVEVLKAGRWAQEPWLPQLQVKKGDRLSMSIYFAHALQEKGKCKIIAVKKETLKVPKQVKKKYEKNPASEDKKAAEG